MTTKCQLQEAVFSPEILLDWASLKKKTDPCFAMLLPMPKLHGVFLACAKDIYHGLFVLPKAKNVSEQASQLRGWGYAVYRARNDGDAMDYLIQYTRDL